MAQEPKPTSDTFMDVVPNCLNRIFPTPLATGSGGAGPPGSRCEYHHAAPAPAAARAAPIVNTVLRFMIKCLRLPGLHTIPTRHAGRSAIHRPDRRMAVNRVPPFPRDAGPRCSHHQPAEARTRRRTPRHALPGRAG